MTGTLLPHTELLESVKIETGYTNIRNLEERLKILATDAEKLIGYNTVLVTKSVDYENDSINYNGNDLWLPKDCWEFTTIYDGDAEMNSDDYWVTGNYLYFRKDKAPVQPILIYEALTFDGHGWPLMSRNHKQAITAYIVWKLYTPKAFMSGNRSERALVRDFQQDWLDERDAAVGNDVMPGSQQEWDKVSATWNSSLIELRMNNNCIVAESEYAIAAKKECVLREVQKMVNVYYWQYSDTSSDIGEAPGISQQFLDTVDKSDLATFLQGITVPYNNVGRIAFAIQGIEEDEYEIYDLLGVRVDNLIFNKYYNISLKLQVYVSVEFYSHSNIFFRLKEKA